PLRLYIRLFVFFFQAEDGIRDFHVTGVQTCALPIYQQGAGPLRARHGPADEPAAQAGGALAAAVPYAGTTAKELALLANSEPLRSEERRVGKECRSRRAPDQYRKKGDEDRR